jgi:polar amino acid transport system ATP-binding protein
MLKIKNLSKSIGDKKILNQISVNVSRGEIAVILGASGVGKSTLLRILNNLETADAGTVELDGNQLDLSKINQQHTVGIVFQHFNLFEHLTVEQNITIALEHVAHKTKSEAHAIATDLLNRYGLADKADCMIGQLSGGQKQRLAIARTLALKPTILCLDEPTSALDPQLTNNVAENISQLTQEGYIVLVATHDVSLLEKMSCTIHLLREGAIIESAHSTDFFANKNNFPNIKSFVSGKN